MIQAKILEAMSERPVSAALIRARFPSVESDARAERILAHMAEEGAIVLMRRGGRNFYRLPPTALPEPGPSTRTPARSLRRPGKPAAKKPSVAPKRSGYTGPILALLDKHPWSRVRDIVDADFVGTNDQRNKMLGLVNVRLSRMMNAGVLSRYKDGDAYRYARRGTMIPCGWHGVAA